jgi:hypothetical protein
VKILTGAFEPLSKISSTARPHSLACTLTCRVPWRCAALMGLGEMAEFRSNCRISVDGISSLCSTQPNEMRAATDSAT